jgi:hypothetical protein
LGASRGVTERNARLIGLQQLPGTTFSQDEYVVQPGDPARLKELFTQWGFRTLAAEVEGRNPSQGELSI